MYDMQNVKRLKAVGESAPTALEAFKQFDAAAMAEGAIPKKYKELIALAVAMTTQCPYCLEIHRKQAIAAGATEAELAETVFIAAALRAGAAVTHGTHIAGME
ncbi:carboxymuconolactone decarboxylase family protein [Methylosinus sporium]|uniref:Carboxymuconolactone decarboxylase family protein n=1 Tax=Methylosinus sporium TaxID=428 RepID=A0A549SPP6_METSR|nr:MULTISPECIES: carboxymuconolactone decarboxylase family protein [Methylosinus]MBU3889444.1 carboxymuconolactone decarboxylase family protein [Methylosinus sp. KRF6]TRL31605.1 carboxymuconolactone decarboxylase family protein [Methylosinus sporium]